MKSSFVLAVLIGMAGAQVNSGFAGGFGSGGGGFQGNNMGYGGSGGYSGGGGGWPGGPQGPQANPGNFNNGGGFGSGFNSGGTFSGGNFGNQGPQGPPTLNSGGGGGVGPNTFSQGGAKPNQVGQIRRFVSVHVGPEEAQYTQTRVIRAGGPPEKHIFVKAPSAASQQNTEVILPEPTQQKTLVYVLIKKQESTSNVRVRGPAAPRATKPEVYFIRYKDNVPPGPVGPAPAGQGQGGFSGDVGGGGSGNAPHGPPNLPPISGGAY